MRKNIARQAGNHVVSGAVSGAESSELRSEGRSEVRSELRCAVSCGTLVCDASGRLLLGHVTGTHAWDIPKGLQDPGETTLEAAMRELREESGAVFAPERFVDLGEFAYRHDKRLHLYRVEAGAELGDLSQLACTSWFPHRRTGKPTLEMDGFRWAGRAEVSQLCWPRMAKLLLTLDW